MCTGLRRILERTEAELSRRPVAIFGDFVHNHHVYDSLSKQGATRVDTVNGIEPGDAVVIGPHGNSIDVLEGLRRSGGELIDVSCPKVKTVIDRAIAFASHGHQVVFVGRAEHEELASIRAEVPDVWCVERLEDVDSLKSERTLAFVAQSTLQVDLFRAVVARATVREGPVIAGETICSETRARQSAAKELSKKVALMVVVGDRRSYNTKALATTCAAFTRVVEVESADELDAHALQGARTVGLTAGASTPDHLVAGVEQRLLSFGGSLASSQPDDGDGVRTYVVPPDRRALSKDQNE